MRYFAELAETGSFYAAANRLSISQQGLNKSITQLERELGTRLVERSRSGILLTPEGKIFLRHAETMLADYDQLLDELFQSEYARTRDEHVIPIYVSYYAANTAASDSDYVGLLANSSYIELPFDELVERARCSDGSDLVFLDVYGSSIARLRKDPELEFCPVIATRLGIVYRKDNPVGELERPSCEDVCNLPVAINTFREMRNLVNGIFAEHPLTRVRLGATSPRMQLECVSSSPETIALFDSFGFSLSQLDRDMPTRGLAYKPFMAPEALCFVGFLLPRRAKLTPRVQSVRSVLRRYLAKTCAPYLAAYPVGELWRQATAPRPTRS